MSETQLERSLKERCMRYEDRISTLTDALTEIAKAEGRYSQDPLTHAANTIEDMVELAKEALQQPST